MTTGIRIGISGWVYAPWRKVFYPPGLRQADELHFASRALTSIELNGSFYALQRPQSYAKWFEQTPDDFVFSIKAPKFITHKLRLQDADTAIANFFASGMLRLKHKLGPVLWQFPPSFEFEPALFEHFLALLPHTAEQAVQLAQKHDDHLKERTYLEADGVTRLRHAIEIRNHSFVDPAFIQLLRRYKVALVVADTAGKWPYCEDVTTDFVYLRLHGDKQLYASGYTDAALQRWDERIQAWHQGGQPEDAQLISDLAPPARQSRDIYCYFDNDTKVKAPFDARKLLARLQLDQGLEPLDWSKA